MMFEFSEFRDFAKKIEELADRQRIDEFMEGCVIDLAKKLLRKVKPMTPVNTGLLRGHWKMGTVTKQGSNYEIEVFNDVEYAEWIENGFKSHWVPGYWSNGQFVYDKKSKTGMQVGKPGGYVEGKFMLKLSEQALENEMERFLQRKQEAFLRKWVGGD